MTNLELYLQEHCLRTIVELCVTYLYKIGHRFYLCTVTFLQSTYQRTWKYLHVKMLLHNPTMKLFEISVNQFQYVYLPRQQCDQKKIAKCLLNLLENDFTRKMKDSDTFSKIP